MDVHLNAFRLTDICENYSLRQCASDLSVPVEFKYHGRKRACAMAVKNGYLVGLLTTETRITRDPLMTRDAQGRMKIVVHDTSGQGDRQALSFFAVNLATGVGLVSRYHGSGSVMAFCSVLANRYRIAKRSYRNAHIAKLEADGEDFSKAAELKKFSPDTLSYTPIYRTGTFVALLKRLDVITEISYDEPTVSEPKYTVVKDQLKVDHRVLRFQTAAARKGQPPKNASRSKIVSFIKSTILGRNVAVATARGKDKQGKVMEPVTISPEVDSFGAYPYNDVVIERNMAIDSVSTLPMIAAMIGVANGNAIFTTPVA